MKYDINAQVPSGGWSCTVEAESPQAALAKALDNDTHPNGPAYEITVRSHMEPLPQDERFANMLVSLPPPLLTVRR